MVSLVYSSVSQNKYAGRTMQTAKTATNHQMLRPIIRANKLAITEK